MRNRVGDQGARGDGLQTIAIEPNSSIRLTHKQLGGCNKGRGEGGAGGGGGCGGGCWGGGNST